MTKSAIGECADVSRPPSHRYHQAAEPRVPDNGRTPDSAALTALIVPVRIIAIVVVVAVLVTGKSVFIPLALAVLASLGMRPLVRTLSLRAQVPAPLTSALLTCLIGVIVSSGLYSLAEPTSQWLKQAPHALRTVQQHASALRGPLRDVREASAMISDLRGRPEASDASLIVTTAPPMEESMVLKTSEIVAYSVATLVMLFFILGWGDRLFRNVIPLLPGFAERRGAVEIVQAIETGIARYLVMITAINSLLGLTVCTLCYFIGLPNPLLWGVVAAFLNFIPYIGSVMTASILLTVSLVSQPLDFHILTAPVAFLLLTTFEGYVITPYAVGRSLTLNPLVIFFSLLVCFYLWGGIGALLTVPILVCCKVALEGSGRSGALMAEALS